MDPLLPVGAAVIAVGAWLSAGYARDIYFGWKSKRWPTTQGRVMEWGTYAGPDITTADDSAAIGYEYEVGGVKYASRRLDYAGRGAGRLMGSVLVRYSQGESVSVRYDPGEPRRALLEPGIALGNIIRLLCGFFVIALGLMFFR
jgi:hypothetical protein